MKKVMIVLALFVCTTVIATDVLAAEITIKWADAQPKTFAYYPAMVAFKDLVEKNTNGKVEVQLFPEGVLGDSKTNLESVKLGAVQIASSSTFTTSSIVPALNVLALPMMFSSRKVFLDFTQTEECRRLESKFEEHGYKCFPIPYVGYLGIQNSKRAVRTPEDLNGLKIRTMQNPILVDTMNAIGAMGVAMSSTELYAAIQTGVIDGASTSAQLLYGLKLYEVAKYYTPVTLHFGGAVAVMNLKFYNSLSPEIQKVIMDAAWNGWKKKVDEYHLLPSKTSDEHIMELFKAAGVTVTEPEGEAFRKASRWVVDKYREKLDQETFDAVSKFTGYKFD